MTDAIDTLIDGWILPFRTDWPPFRPSPTNFHFFFFDPQNASGRLEIIDTRLSQPFRFFFFFKRTNTERLMDSTAEPEEFIRRMRGCNDLNDPAVCFGSASDAIHRRCRQKMGGDKICKVPPTACIWRFLSTSVFTSVNYFEDKKQRLHQK